MFNFFRPKPGRFGIAPTLLTVSPVFGTLAAGTVVHNLGSVPSRCYVNSIRVSATTFPTAATSIAATLRRKPAGDAVALTSGIDVNTADAATGVAGAFTATQPNRVLAPGETLQLSVVTTGDVTQQPVGLIVVVELLVME